jgi:hydroxymethylbilane synthase
MPTDLPDGLILAAIPEREEPRDALIGRPLSELRPGAVVGTSSLRRSAQLYALGLGITTKMLRGNVDTRLRKLDDREYDAIVLAAAGLRRLGWQDRIRELLPVEVMCPAVGQGALAIETRDDHGTARTLVSKLDHLPSRIAVTAERSLLGTLGGGCQVPIGGHATVDGQNVHLRAIVASPDGTRLIRTELSGTAAEPAKLGEEAGRVLLDKGAREILNEVYAA